MKEFRPALPCLLLLTLSMLPALDPATGEAHPASAAAGAPAARPEAIAPPPRAVTAPLLFVENRGQLDPAVEYYLKDGGRTVYFTETEIVFGALAGGRPDRGRHDRPGDPAVRESDGSEADKPERLVLRLSPAGAPGPASIAAHEPDRARINIFHGNDPNRWLTDIPTYRELLYADVFPGVDIRFYEDDGGLRYDFIVRPGADPAAVAMRLTGADSLDLAADDLVASAGLGGLTQAGLRVYQDGLSGREEISGAFRVDAQGVFGFEVGPYDPSRSLVIDPVLVFSTYLGGAAADTAYNIHATDTAVYVCGQTASAGFPVAGAYDSTLAGTDAFVSKFSADGTSLLFSTFLGGTGTEAARGVHFYDDDDTVWVAGQTDSNNFPLVNPRQGTNGGMTDAFIAKLSNGGNSLLYSTYHGGHLSENVFDAAGGSDFFYVCGATDSNTFPAFSVGGDAYQETFVRGPEAFVVCWDMYDASAYYSTYLGASGVDLANGVDWGAGDKAVVAGYTSGSYSGGASFPTTAGVVQTTFGGGTWDGFVAKLSTFGTSLEFSTYLGGGGEDVAQDVATDTSGNIYVVGHTQSGNFPVLNAYQASLAGSEDCFLTRLNSTGTTLAYSTYFGGSSHDEAFAVDVDSSWHAHVTGYTTGGMSGFPIRYAYQSTLTGMLDDNVFVTKFDPGVAGDASLISSTYVGRDGADERGLGIFVPTGLWYAGSSYVCGYTDSTTFPTANAYQTDQGGQDAFVLLFSDVDIRIDPASIDFGAVLNGSTSTWRTITVHSDGLSHLCMEGVTLIGAHPTQFKIQNDLVSNQNIAPGSSKTIQVQFAPNSVGTKTATLRFPSNDPNESPYDVTLSGTAPVLASVLTSTMSLISYTTATCGGNVESDGGASVTARGVCWSTLPSPTIDNAKTTNGSGLGLFTSNLTGLVAGTRYYVRAYATNLAGTAYGGERTFDTLSLTVPTVTTTVVSSITQTTASSGGTVTSDGGASVTARGVCWSTSPNPITANPKTVNGTGTGTFTSGLTGLLPGTTYYVRAYATNSQGTAYGNERSFTTAAVALPTLTTTAVTAITQTTASSGGSISADGGSAITARGVCWGTAENPTTAGSKTTDGTGTGSFTSAITGLSAMTPYYVRAYATNVAGTAYGNQESFTTAAAAPYQVILPEVIWASATGGGNWLSEVQITDRTGGSQVSAWFNTSTGRRGPFVVSTGTAAGQSVKFPNFLQTLDGLDGEAFAYYGKVGAVQFTTQDDAHEIRVSARTVNGSYGKTFQGRTPDASELAIVGRAMVIQNLANSASYRSAVGFFNPTGDGITVDFTLHGPDGPIGVPFVITFPAYGFLHVMPFDQAGVPYPGSSHDNAVLRVNPTSGSGGLLCFGATANNITNDPSAHTAVQEGVGYWNSPASLQILPEVIWAPATGDGLWVSEVQVTDLTGGSIVSVTFSTAAGVRGPFTLWTSDAGYDSARFTNLLQTIDGLDAGAFEYYGKVGAVRFETQDAGHLIHVTARTVNGNYGKTFQGLSDIAENSVDLGNGMMIPDVISNADYRSAAGFFNVGTGPVTLELRIYGAAGQIGSTFLRTIPAGGFANDMIFIEAGAPYPGSSHDNAWLQIQATSGTGRVLCFGATANNATNDPSAHSALRY